MLVTLRYQMRAEGLVKCMDHFLSKAKHHGFFSC
jgi:hypothetical protein